MEQTIITKDVTENILVVTRTFHAPRTKVWQAWTTSDSLEKWWAPKPWQAVTKSFDFSPGGHWHYYMSGPAGEKHWGKVDYESITPEENFTAKDSFCDEDGNQDTRVGAMHWKVEFRDLGGPTDVIVTITFANGNDMSKVIEMGFEEGFKMALDNLEELLAA